jgi:hypothetical protein
MMDSDDKRYFTDIKGPSRYLALVLPLQSNNESPPLLRFEEGETWKSFDWLVLILLRLEEFAIWSDRNFNPEPQLIAVGMRTSPYSLLGSLDAPGSSRVTENGGTDS